MKRKIIFGFLLIFLGCENSAYSQLKNGSISVYPDRLNDLQAVYFDKNSFNVKADGITDDGPALQEAINKIESQSKSGIVFIPEGTYCIKTTVNIWAGIRLIGYGKLRPLFLLPSKTIGFQSSEGKHMIRFCDRRTPEGMPTRDGTPGTLFSGLCNVDFKIEDGNPGAIAVRFHVAQHSFLKHINFEIGNGRAAVDEMGSEISDCHFLGGEWAIKTGLPSAGWQSLVMDCDFVGQRNYSIETKDAGMTIFRCRFKNTPIGVNILQGNSEKLFVKDSWFENIKDVAIRIGNYYDPKTQVNLENLKFSNVPVSVDFLLLPGVITAVSRDSLHRKTNSALFEIRRLSHGLKIKTGDDGKIQREFSTKSQEGPIESLGQFTSTDIPAFPPQSTWVNLIDLGAKADGKTDNTKLLNEAIQKYNTIYIPSGKYLLSGTVLLKEKSALIGLHPSSTKFILRDSTVYFNDTNNPNALFVTPRGGTNIINGFSIDLGFNPGAIGIKWLAGESSYLNDIHLPSKRSMKKGEGQYYGLWVTDGGGGVFKNSWFPNEAAKNGFFVSKTTTLGRVYMLSVEHHKDTEILLEDIANWTFYSLQTEEDLGSERAFAVTMNKCQNVHFVNLYCYRRASVREPFVSAVKINKSNNITIKGMHSFSSGPFPYDNTVFMEESSLLVPQAEFSEFTIK
mgnify:CR=1 FL=1